ncbi:MAG: hypothetical protein U0V73_16115 [Acidimicrobiia bacterium]
MATGAETGYATLSTVDWALLGLAVAVNIGLIVALVLVPRRATNRLRRALRNTDPTVRREALAQVSSVSLRPYVKQLVYLHETERDGSVRAELAATLLRSDATWSRDKRLRDLARWAAAEKHPGVRAAEAAHAAPEVAPGPPVEPVRASRNGAARPVVPGAGPEAAEETVAAETVAAETVAAETVAAETVAAETGAAETVAEETVAEETVATGERETSEPVATGEVAPAPSGPVTALGSELIERRPVAPLPVLPYPRGAGAAARTAGGRPPGDEEQTPARPIKPFGRVGYPRPLSEAGAGSGDVAPRGLAGHVPTPSRPEPERPVPAGAGAGGPAVALFGRIGGGRPVARGRAAGTRPDTEAIAGGVSRWR